MNPEEFETVYSISGRDFSNAGRVSTAIKNMLKSLGVPATVVRRIAIVTYEAEMNIVMYASRGRMTLKVNPQTVTLDAEDEGPGIENVTLAMQEGYSTATAEMREMGFGAGMGLPNMARNADVFHITSEVGHGTKIHVQVNQAA
jgi:serine/threonine-protein kinase RsbT